MRDTTPAHLYASTPQLPAPPTSTSCPVPGASASESATACRPSPTSDGPQMPRWVADSASPLASHPWRLEARIYGGGRRPFADNRHRRLNHAPSTLCIATNLARATMNPPNGPRTDSGAILVGRACWADPSDSAEGPARLARFGGFRIRGGSPMSGSLTLPESAPLALAAAIADFRCALNHTPPAPAALQLWAPSSAPWKSPAWSPGHETEQCDAKIAPQLEAAGAGSGKGTSAGEGTAP